MQKKGGKKGQKKSKKEVVESGEQEVDGVFSLEQVSSPLVGCSSEYVAQQDLLVVAQGSQVVFYQPTSKRLLHTTPLSSQAICFTTHQDSLMVLEANGKVQLVSLANFQIVESWQAVHGQVEQGVFLGECQEVLVKLQGDHRSVLRSAFQQGHKPEVIHTFDFYLNSKQAQEDQEPPSPEYHLAVCREGRYVVESRGQVVNLFDLSLNRTLRYLRHHQVVSCLSVSAGCTRITLGDLKGTLTHLHQPVTTPQYTPLKETKVQWHSQQVNSLALDPSGEYLYSGGQEGVVVTWHLQSNQKTFMPRFRGGIVGLKCSEQHLLVSLSTNQTVVVGLADQQPLGDYQSLFVTPASLPLLRFHPQQPNCLVSPGLLGTLHFLSFPQPVLTHSLPVVSRNLQFTSTLSSQCQVTCLAMSPCGNHLAVAVQREGQDNLMSQLVFYSENGLLSYEPHTRIEQPHGNSINQLVYLKESSQFLSTGSDHHFRLWQETHQTLPARLTTSNQDRQDLSQQEQQPSRRVLWSCGFKGNFKGLAIYECVELSATQVLLSLKNTLVVWDLSCYKALMSFNLKNGPESKVVLLEDNRVLVHDHQSIHVLDLAQQQMLKQVRLQNILKVVPAFSDSPNDVLIVQQEKDRTLFIQYDLKVGYIKHSCQTPQRIVAAIHLHHQGHHLLFCLDPHHRLSLLRRGQPTPHLAQPLPVQEEPSLLKAHPKENSKTFQSQYEIMHKKQVKKESLKEVFHRDSHLVSNVEYLLDEFLLHFSHLNVSHSPLPTYLPTQPTPPHPDSDDQDLEADLDILNRKRINAAQFKKQENKLTLEEQQEMAGQLKGIAGMFSALFPA